MLRAIEDPRDRVSLVAALRSSFFGVERPRHRRPTRSSGRRPGAAASTPARPGGAVLAPALELLDDAAPRAPRTRASRRCSSACTTRRGSSPRSPARAAARRRSPTSRRWRRSRARPPSSGALTLRGFTRLLEERIANAREEPDLPSTRPGDPDTVRVLSIHKAKGLEAPVVALFDSDDDAQADRRRRAAVERAAGSRSASAAAASLPAGTRWCGRRRRRPGPRRGACSTWRARGPATCWCCRGRRSTRAPGDFWRELVARLPPASDADVRLVDAETLRRPETAGARARAVGARRGGGRRRRRRALGESAGASCWPAPPSGRSSRCRRRGSRRRRRRRP